MNMDESRNNRLAEMPNNVPESSPKTQPQVYPQSSRPRPQVTRSISEVSSPSRLRHSTTSGERPSHSGPRTKTNPTAAGPATPSGPAPRSSFDISRSHQHQHSGATSGTAAGGASTSPARISPNPSRRPSSGAIQPATLEEPAPMPSTSNAAALSLALKPAAPPSSAVASRDAEGDGSPGSVSGVGMAPEKMEGLKKTISELGTFSATATKRLDDTYYSVLERLSMLQSTIVAIKGLALVSKRMDHAFQAEANEVVREANSQLEAFGNFEQHQNKIEVLQERILRGRNKINALSRRVDMVGDKIDGWEKADKEWQERTRKRLKIIWCLILVVAAAFFLLFVFSPPPPTGSEEAAAVGTRSPLDGLSFPGGKESGTSSNRTSVNFKPSRTGSDERLRVFDEL